MASRPRNVHGFWEYAARDPSGGVAGRCGPWDQARLLWIAPDTRQPAPGIVDGARARGVALAVARPFAVEPGETNVVHYQDAVYARRGRSGPWCRTRGAGVGFVFRVPLGAPLPVALPDHVARALGVRGWLLWTALVARARALGWL